MSPEAGRMSGGRVFDDLIRRYGEPHRRYHGWNHVLRCLDQFELVAARLRDPDAVELALWFHDAVYVPGATDNEKRSAELFCETGRGLFHMDFIEKVHSFTMLTRHNLAPSDSDGEFVVDIDLSSLASGWDRFMEDSDRIRQEQCGISDGRFYPAQAKFLRSLVDRPQIFYSTFFHERYERSARDNINRFLDGLRTRGLLRN
jgi:predicted metal-dependent HD superfamily phosphohydrolase